MLTHGAQAALNSTVTQQVTVTVVPGFLDVTSPLENGIYQDNQLLLKIKVTTGSNKVKTIWMTDGKDKVILCSKCKAYSEKRYFSDGKHEILIKVEFDNGESVEKQLNFQVDTKADIYISTSSGLKKATSKDIADYLTHYNFTISYQNEMTPEDSCSVRAKNKNASLSFYSIASIEQGQGTLSGKINKKTFSMNFKVSGTVENSEERIILDIEGSKKETAVLEFDKLNKKVKITGENFSFSDMDAYFVKGCSARKQNFYLLEKGKRMNRGIEEIRTLLDTNPIFLDKFGNLKIFYNSFWWRFANLLV